MSGARRVAFIGSKPLGLRVLQVMHELAPAALVGVVTIDDRADTRTAFDGFERFCAERNIALRVAGSHQESEQMVRELRPDLCFVAGWYWLVSGELIDAVPAGLIGIHYSELPRFRGGSPLVWQIASGQASAGFSFFSLTRGMDDGPLWIQGSVPIGPEDYVEDVLARLEAETLSRLRGAYPAILAGLVKPVPQRAEQASYCAQRSPADGNIDWTAPAREIYNFIRAQSRPYPGAFTHVNGAVLKVWRSRPYDSPYYGTPGQLVRAGPDVLAVCGDRNALVLEEVETNGARGRGGEIIRSTKFRLSPHAAQ